MRALLDENMPKGLLRLLTPAVEVRTVQQEGWSGRKNGELLTVASSTFDVLITTDQGIPHQQNLSEYDIGIILMEARSNRIEDLAPLVPDVKASFATQDLRTRGYITEIITFSQLNDDATRLLPVLAL